MKAVSQDKLDDIKEKMRQEMEAKMKQEVEASAREKAMAEAKAEAEAHARAEMENLLADKDQTEKEKKRIQMALNELSQEKDEVFQALEKERREQEEIELKLKAMEAKVLHGNENLLEKEEEQQRELRRQEEALAEQRRQEEEAQKRISELEEMQLIQDEKYNSLEDEIEMKTKKLKKLGSKFQAARLDAQDLQEEFQREREDMLESIRSLTQQLKLKNLVIDSFVPPAGQERIEMHTRYDDREGVWVIEHEQFAGNCMRERRKQQAPHSGDGAQDQQDRVKAALSAAFGEEGEMLFNASDNEKLQNVFFSYKAVGVEFGPDGEPIPAQEKPKRPGTASRRPGSAARPGSGRPRSARPKGPKGPDIGSLNDSVANLEDDDKEKSFPKARGLRPGSGRPK
mmetsp:Transcript_607/g.1994  ORF Transcript_607/g.1994 Transcript_607/m.1994 type:complete len:399 (-) Transcript_607:7-1203(-)